MSAGQRVRAGSASAARGGPRLARALWPVLLATLPACMQDAPLPSQVAEATVRVDAKARAHAELAHRVRRFLIDRGARGPVAADDERFRLGAFWRARADTHHFGPDFHARARVALAAPGGPTEADAALRALQATVDTRLPDWQALVDYNASGRMRDDAGEEGRRLLPWAIAALDAIEAAAWRYVDTVEWAPTRG